MDNKLRDVYGDESGDREAYYMYIILYTIIMDVISDAQKDETETDDTFLHRLDEIKRRYFSRISRHTKDLHYIYHRDVIIEEKSNIPLTLFENLDVTDERVQDDLDHISMVLRRRKAKIFEVIMESFYSRVYDYLMHYMSWLRERIKLYQNIESQKSLILQQLADRINDFISRKTSEYFSRKTGVEKLEAILDALLTDTYCVHRNALPTNSKTSIKQIKNCPDLLKSIEDVIFPANSDLLIKTAFVLKRYKSLIPNSSACVFSETLSRIDSKIDQLKKDFGTIHTVKASQSYDIIKISPNNMYIKHDPRQYDYIYYVMNDQQISHIMPTHPYVHTGILNNYEKVSTEFKVTSGQNFYIQSMSMPILFLDLIKEIHIHDTSLTSLTPADVWFDDNKWMIIQKHRRNAKIHDFLFTDINDEYKKLKSTLHNLAGLESKCPNLYLRLACLNPNPNYNKYTNLNSAINRLLMFYIGSLEKEARTGVKSWYDNLIPASVDKRGNLDRYLNPSKDYYSDDKYVIQESWLFKIQMLTSKHNFYEHILSIECDKHMQTTCRGSFGTHLRTGTNESDEFNDDKRSYEMYDGMILSICDARKAEYHKAHVGKCRNDLQLTFTGNNGYKFLNGNIISTYMIERLLVIDKINAEILSQMPYDFFTTTSSDDLVKLAYHNQSLKASLITQRCLDFKFTEKLVLFFSRILQTNAYKDITRVDSNKILDLKILTKVLTWKDLIKSYRESNSDNDITKSLHDELYRHVKLEMTVMVGEYFHEEGIPRESVPYIISSSSTSTENSNTDDFRNVENGVYLRTEDFEAEMTSIDIPALKQLSWQCLAVVSLIGPELAQAIACRMHNCPEKEFNIKLERIATVLERLKTHAIHSDNDYDYELTEFWSRNDNFDQFIMSLESFIDEIPENAKWGGSKTKCARRSITKKL